MISNPTHFQHGNLNNPNTINSISNINNQFNFQNALPTHQNMNIPQTPLNNLAPFNFYFPKENSQLGFFREPNLTIPQPFPFCDIKDTFPKAINTDPSSPFEPFLKNFQLKNFANPPQTPTDIVTLQNQYFQTEHYIQELQNIQNHLKLCKQQLAQTLNAPFPMNNLPKEVPAARMFPSFAPQQAGYFFETQPSSLSPLIDQHSQKNSMQNIPSPILGSCSNSIIFSNSTNNNQQPSFTSSRQLSIGNIDQIQKSSNINTKRSYPSLHKDSSQTKIEENYEDIVDLPSTGKSKKLCTDETKSATSPILSVQQTPAFYMNSSPQPFAGSLMPQSNNYFQQILPENPRSLMQQQLPAFGNQTQQYAQQQQQIQFQQSQQLTSNPIITNEPLQTLDASSSNHIKLMVKKEFNTTHLPQQHEKIQEQNKITDQKATPKTDEQPCGEDSDEDKKCKKEIQNDSNYTKNLLKGFRRFMFALLRDNKEALDRFQSYFYDNTLSNEFILSLLEDSPYRKEFQQFLETDPSWWIKEAKIKDITRQLRFFETVKARNYSEIRTKRKSKQVFSSISPSALSMISVSLPPIQSQVEAMSKQEQDDNNKKDNNQERV